MSHEIRTQAGNRLWGLLLADLGEDNGKPSKDDCAICRRMFDAERNR